jgi:hypothetical protein
MFSYTVSVFIGMGSLGYEKLLYGSSMRGKKLGNTALSTYSKRTQTEGVWEQSFKENVWT